MLASVAALLLCSLATMELPELVNLIDDTSNDFSLVLIAKDAPTLVKVRVGVLPRGRQALAETERRLADVSSGIDSRFQPGWNSDEMLHLLCVHRT